MKTEFAAFLTVALCLVSASARPAPRPVRQFIRATATNASDIQSSPTLDPSAIATDFANDGQDVPEAGQVASLTSTNNFINFCALGNLQITNGLQLATGSCDPVPMGDIPANTAMPSSKFAFPQNMATIPANTAFTIQMNINNLETGNFVNADENYFAAPQQLNTAGQIIGHSHVVIEALDSITQATPTNPEVFAFFKGLNAAAVNGLLTADVTKGLPAGAYRLSSINAAANHQPVLVPVAQHGSLDDAIYFLCVDNSTAAAAPPAAAAAANATAAAGAAANSTVAAGTAANTTAVAGGAANGTAAATDAAAAGAAGAVGAAAGAAAAKGNNAATAAKGKGAAGKFAATGKGGFPKAGKAAAPKGKGRGRA